MAPGRGGKRCAVRDAGRLLTSGLTVVLTALAVRTAAGQVVGTAEVAAGAGHDSNMFPPLVVDPATRPPLVGGWFGRVAPRLSAGVVAAGWRLETAYVLDYRGSDAAGHLVDQRLELGVNLPRLGPLALVLTLAGGRFDATRYSDDRFLFASAELAARLELGASVRVAAAYRAEPRRYPNRATSDLVHTADARLTYQPAGAVGPFYLALDPVRLSLVDATALRVARAGPDLELVIRRVSLGLWGWGGALDRPDAVRLWQMGAGLGCLVRLGDHLDAVVTADWTGSPGSSDPAAGDYARRYVALSLVAHASGRTRVSRPDEPARLAPLVEGGRARLRVRAARAAAVAVIGSWDDWQAEGQPLIRKDSDLWEAWIALPPGQHRYRFLVDGQSVRAPDAPRYLPDDFGQEDAVLEVPAP
jgi:hypothetical protein